MTGEIVDYPEDGQNTNNNGGFLYRHRRGIGYTALTVVTVSAVAAMPAVRIWGESTDNAQVAAVQRALPATGFEGTVQELNPLAFNQAYADIQASPDCRLPGVIVSYTFSQDGASIVDFDLQEVYSDGNSTNQMFTGPADLPQALARDGQSCAQAAAQLEAQAVYTGAW